ncbi:VOC family protein [Chamaesiphon sp. VAR_48_metabat_403]|uniref:VOC family protein n=1 Tax=Chamaesiphon sp. VAR_48_metabat_403 TaxID=2964700 RepID=UPI00286D70C5|nr:VOC family protein [Chamaesiphon sp. VAR_48_metabat_403]
MMTNPMQQHGAFSWCELITTDTTAAKEFYSRLFGWEIIDRPVAGMMYSVLNIEDRGVGGLMGMTPELPAMPPSWGVYVTVDDVDTTIKLVEDLGGIVKYPPTDIPDTGRFALIQDPQGAVFSIISYSSTT